MSFSDAEVLLETSLLEPSEKVREECGQEGGGAEVQSEPAVGLDSFATPDQSSSVSPSSCPCLAPPHLVAAVRKPSSSTATAMTDTTCTPCCDTQKKLFQPPPPPSTSLSCPPDVVLLLVYPSLLLSSPSHHCSSPLPHFSHAAQARAQARTRVSIHPPRQDRQAGWTRTLTTSSKPSPDTPRLRPVMPPCALIAFKEVIGAYTSCGWQRLDSYIGLSPPSPPSPPPLILLQATASASSSAFARFPGLPRACGHESHPPAGTGGGSKGRK
eukprot:337799-Hanusia_phi.AAC.2